MFTSHYLKITFALLVSLSCLNCHANDNDNPAAFTVQLDATIIKATGIQTQKLQRTQYSPEIETFATRVDLSPLFDARKEYFTALAKKEKAKIILKQSRKNAQHLKNLQSENVVSTRKLLTQKSQLALDEAGFKTAVQHADNIHLRTRTQWESVLSHWFLTEEYPYAHLLNTVNRPVYLIYLPATFSSPLATVAVHPTGRREKAQSASLISSAPIYSIDQPTGTPYFYFSDQQASDFHQRVVVWLPLKEAEMSGFIIPASAIVWHLGLAYVYLQVDDEHFKRVKIIQKKLLSTTSYFVQEPFTDGDMLVSLGAQLLLSEEFRSQIPAEDDDD